MYPPPSSEPSEQTVPYRARPQHAPPPGPQRAPRLYRVMIGCGLAGLLLGGIAAIVDFSTGKHPQVKLPPGLSGLPTAPGGTGGPGLPSLPSGFPSLPSLPSGFPSLPSLPSGFPSLPGLPSLPSFPVPPS